MSWMMSRMQLRERNGSMSTCSQSVVPGKPQAFLLNNEARPNEDAAANCQSDAHITIVGILVLMDHVHM